MSLLIQCLAKQLQDDTPELAAIIRSLLAAGESAESIIIDAINTDITPSQLCRIAAFAQQESLHENNKDCAR